jgi:3-oxoacyl-[acyl-carrier-protein] synthase II
VGWSTDVISPLINIENLDSKVSVTGFNVTPNVAVQKTVTGALANSLGFGGTNASLVFQAL